MITKPPQCTRSIAPPRVGRATTVRLAVAATVALASLTGCSSATPDANSQAGTPRNVSLTAAQRTSIHLLTVEPASYHTSITTTAVVDFDHDRSTPVLALSPDRSRVCWQRSVITWPPGRRWQW